MRASSTADASKDALGVVGLRPEDAGAISPSTELGSEGEGEEEEWDSDSDSDSGSDGEGFGLPREGTLLIFDWDDTVLPSTWIRENGLRLDEESEPTVEQRASLDAVAEAAAATLRLAKRHGQTVLVTNAERGWIELSCKKFMPSLLTTLEGIKLVSARSTYEERGVTSPFEWKFLAFEVEISEFSAGSAAAVYRKNIISFGDSAHEREALIRATQHMPECYTKSLKFVERPEVDQLLTEHKLLGGCFSYVVRHDGNLDLCIQCS